MNGPTNKKINSIIYHGVLLKVLLAPGGLMLGFFCSCAAAGTHWLAAHSLAAVGLQTSKHATK